MGKCEHGLTSKECLVCASPKHGAAALVQEPVTAANLRHTLTEIGYELGMLFRPQRPAEPVQEPAQEPVGIVGTQEDVWKGYGGQWAPPGPPIKTVHMLRDLPHGTLLYTAAPPQRKPLTEEEIAELARQEQFLLVCDGLDELTEIARAIERAHGIGGQP